jgi:microcystin-dependent protein
MLIHYMPPPLGTVMNYTREGSTIPPGYALTLGQALWISDYPELFAAIGYTYGPGPPGTFLLPSYRDSYHNPCLIYTGKSV